MMKALLVVDVQNDFLSTGALPAADADQVIPVINALQEKFDRVIATQDWHPPDHGSFHTVQQKEIGEMGELGGLPQVVWPVHCVENTRGAAFPDGLHTEKFEKVIQKGIDPEIDSYGAFFDNGHKRDTGLAAYLKAEGIDHLYVVGLTTDYCVKATVLDGLNLGFKITLITDGCRAVNLQPHHEAQAIEEMRAAGAEIVTSQEIA